jgi:hypothetical protein
LYTINTLKRERESRSGKSRRVENRFLCRLLKEGEVENENWGSGMVGLLRRAGTWCQHLWEPLARRA